MPKQQIAVIQRQGIPFVEIHLDLHFISADFLKGDQWRIDCSS